MSRRLFVVGVLSLGSLVIAQSTEQEVMKAAQARVEARRTGNAAAHAKLVADDFLQIGNSGRMMDKKAAVSLAAAPKMGLRDLRTQLFGDVAVVTGVQPGSGRASAIDVRFTHVWQRRNGQWLNVFVHNTPVASAPPSSAAPKPNQLMPTKWPKLANRDEQAVIDAHRRLQDAFAQKDAKGYAAISTSNFVRIGELGRMVPAQEFLKAVSSTPEQNQSGTLGSQQVTELPVNRRNLTNLIDGTNIFHGSAGRGRKRPEVDHRDFRVRVYGPVAVLTWLNVAAQNTISRSRIFVKEVGTWKQLVAQGTYVIAQ